MGFYNVYSQNKNIYLNEFFLDVNQSMNYSSWSKIQRRGIQKGGKT